MGPLSREGAKNWGPITLYAFRRGALSDAFAQGTVEAADGPVNGYRFQQKRVACMFMSSDFTSTRPKCIEYGRSLTSCGKKAHWQPVNAVRCS